MHATGQGDLLISQCLRATDRLPTVPAVHPREAVRRSLGCTMIPDESDAALPARARPPRRRVRGRVDPAADARGGSGRAVRSVRARLLRHSPRGVRRPVRPPACHRHAAQTAAAAERGTRAVVPAPAAGGRGVVALAGRTERAVRPTSARPEARSSGWATTRSAQRPAVSPARVR